MLLRKSSIDYLSCLQRISKSIVEFVLRTPAISEDEVVILAPFSDARQSVRNIMSANHKDLVDPIIIYLRMKEMVVLNKIESEEWNGIEWNET